MGSNSVENGYYFQDDKPLEGFGGGLYNGGDAASATLNRVAIFQDNVGDLYIPFGPNTACKRPVA